MVIRCAPAAGLQVQAAAAERANAPATVPGLSLRGVLGPGRPNVERDLVFDYLRAHCLISAGFPREGDLCGGVDPVEDCVQRLFGGMAAAWNVAGLPEPD